MSDGYRVETERIRVEGVFSGCCGSEEYHERRSYTPISEQPHRSYKCAECDGPVAWGLNNDHNLVNAHEASAVFEDFEGKLWFAWHFVSDPTSVKELVAKGQELVGPQKRLVASLTREMNQYGDMIDYRHHRSFMWKWKKQVENPSLANAF